MAPSRAAASSMAERAALCAWRVRLRRPASVPRARRWAPGVFMGEPARARGGTGRSRNCAEAAPRSRLFADGWKMGVTSAPGSCCRRSWDGERGAAPAELTLALPTGRRARGVRLPCPCETQNPEPAASSPLLPRGSALSKGEAAKSQLPYSPPPPKGESSP